MDNREAEHADSKERRKGGRKKVNKGIKKKC
jgi:hypothetical protein